MFGKNKKTKESTNSNVMKENQNNQDSEKKKSRKEKKNEIRQKRSTQNVFRYRKMCEDGICELGNDIYSLSIGFSDIDYQIATEENQQIIFGKYQNILNSLGNDIDMCLTINNRLLDIKEFEENMLLKHVGDGKDSQRAIINDYILSNLKKGNNKIVSEKLFTFSAKEANIRDARRTLGNISAEFEKSFRDMKCNTHVMNGVERLDTLYSIVKPGEKLNFSYERLAEKESTKDYIAPYCFDFKESRDYFRIDSRYCKVLYLSSWASEMGDKLLYRLSNLEHNLTMTIHMKVVPRGKDKELIKTKLNALDKQIGNENRRNIKNMMDPDQIPVHLRMSYAGTTELLEEVSNRDQRMFYTSVFVMINAPTRDEMELVTKDVKVICTQCDCEFAEMSLEQEDGFNAVLPLGNPKEELARLVTSKVCSIFMPFTSKELMNPKHPIFYGVNQITNNMILCNRFDLETPSGWILGKPGQGKSFKVKQELTYVYLSDPTADIVIVDPQGEYARLAEGYNKMFKKEECSILPVNNHSSLHFNPFDGDITEPDFARRKAEFIQIIMAEMLGNGFLTPAQISIVDQIVFSLYLDYQNDLNVNPRKAHMPTLTTFYNKLAKLTSVNSVAAEMYQSLWTYVNGSYDIFAKASNVDINSRFVVYDISSLGTVMQTLGYKIVLENIRNQVIQNRKKHKRTYIYIDEIYLLLKDEYSENFLFEFWKWVRKYNGCITGMTQNITDLLNSEKASTMLGNSEFLILLGQAPADLNQLQHLIGLSKEQYDILYTATKGTGLIKFGQSAIIPFKDDFPKENVLFELWNTDPDLDKKKKESEDQEEHYIKGAIPFDEIFSTNGLEASSTEFYVPNSEEEAEKLIEEGPLEIQKQDAETDDFVEELPVDPEELFKRAKQQTMYEDW